MFFSTKKRERKNVYTEKCIFNNSNRIRLCIAGNTAAQRIKTLWIFVRKNPFKAVFGLLRKAQKSTSFYFKNGALKIGSKGAEFSSREGRFISAAVPFGGVLFAALTVLF